MQKKVFICNKSNINEKIEVSNHEIIHYLLDRISNDLEDNIFNEFDSSKVSFIVDESTFADFNLNKLFENNKIRRRFKYE